MTVIINPKIKVEVQKQLTEEYGQWDIYQDKEFITLVDPEKFQGGQKYNKSLKEFLKPVIQNTNLKKNKCSKRIKTYTQVLEITIDSESDKNEEN